MMFATVQTNLGVFIHEVTQSLPELLKHLGQIYQHHQNVKISIKKTAPSLV